MQYLIGGEEVQKGQLGAMVEMYLGILEGVVGAEYGMMGRGEDNNEMART